MRRQRLAILGVVVLLLAAVAVPQAFKRGAAATSQSSSLKKPSAAGEFRGMTLQVHSYWEGIPFEKYVEEIARSGANTICLSLAAYQENASASSLFIEYRKVPSVERLRKLIRLSHDLGLRVVLMPIILLENPLDGQWRGKIDPGQPDAWWEDYENYILFYAAVAQETGVELLMIGSELVSLEDQTARWRGLIRKVRKAYKGRLSYSANWDHYKGIQWWPDLDLIGMTVYHDLVGDKKPSLKVLMESWAPIKTDILDWRKKIGLSIIFTEVGWPNLETAAKEPWNYVRNEKPDPQLQADCFEAFFRTWRNEQSVAGVLIWEWRNHPSQAGGVDDTSYFPGGKPAMDTIRKYFQSPGDTAGAAESPKNTRTAPARRR